MERDGVVPQALELPRKAVHAAKAVRLVRKDVRRHESHRDACEELELAVARAAAAHGDVERALLQRVCEAVLQVLRTVVAGGLDVLEHGHIREGLVHHGYDRGLGLGKLLLRGLAGVCVVLGVELGGVALLEPLRAGLAVVCGTPDLGLTHAHHERGQKAVLLVAAHAVPIADVYAERGAVVGHEHQSERRGARHGRGGQVCGAAATPPGNVPARGRPRNQIAGKHVRDHGIRGRDHHVVREGERVAGAHLRRGAERVQVGKRDGRVPEQNDEVLRYAYDQARDHNDRGTRAVTEREEVCRHHDEKYDGHLQQEVACREGLDGVVGRQLDRERAQDGDGDQDDDCRTGVQRPQVGAEEAYGAGAVEPPQRVLVRGIRVLLGRGARVHARRTGRRELREAVSHEQERDARERDGTQPVDGVAARKQALAHHGLQRSQKRDGDHGPRHDAWLEHA